jgi:hypothetical protein
MAACDAWLLAAAALVAFGFWFVLVGAVYCCTLHWQ